MANQAEVSTVSASDADALLASLVDHSRMSGTQIAAVLGDLSRIDPGWLDQWVIVCAGSRLYADGEVPADSAEARPQFYDDRAEAARDQRALAARAENPGVGRWESVVARLRELPTLARIPAAPMAALPEMSALETVGALAEDYPAPADRVYLEFALLLPGGTLHRDDDAAEHGRSEAFGPEGTRYTVYLQDWDAESAAAELREDMARQGIDYPVRVVARQVVTVTSVWA